MPVPGIAVAGHVFVVQADVTTIDCDAWLCPTDRSFSVSDDFLEALGAVQKHLTGHTWADHRAVKFKGGPVSGPLIVLGDVGQVEPTPSEDAAAPVRELMEVLDDFVEVAAAELGSGRFDGPLRLALPLIGTGRGGFKDLKGDTVRPLLTTLNRLADEKYVDFVLCTNTSAAWSAVQSVRSSEDWVALSKEEMEWAAGLATEACAGRLALFIGAGVSTDAGLADWRGLLGKLDVPDPAEGERGIPATLDLRDLATLIERKNGRSELLSRIEEEIGGDHPVGLTHALLASLATQQAITTNYDNLFESACVCRDRASGNALAVLPYERVQGERPWLLKLHGSLDHLDHREDRDDIVLTRSDYMRAQRQRGALFGIVQAVLMTKHLLFVGYSLTDEDFHQLVDEIREALAPAADGQPARQGTVLTFGDSSSAMLWDDLLDVIPFSNKQEGAARRLQIFLDRVAHGATPHHAHLLEKSFKGLLDDDECRIAAILREVEGTVGSILATKPEHPTAIAVRLALERFGAAPLATS